MYRHSKYANLGSTTLAKKKEPTKQKPKLLRQQIDSGGGNSNSGLLHILPFLAGSL